MFFKEFHMLKKWLGLGAFLGLAPLVWGHFVFIIPATDGKSVEIVFSDGDGPDKSVPISKIASTKVFAIDGGKSVPLSHSVVGNALQAKVPSESAKVIFGKTDYGVVQKGDKDPFHLVYHSKTILGDPFSSEVLGGSHDDFEIKPVKRGDKTQFLVLTNGKPLAESEITIRKVGTRESEKSKTNKEGIGGEISQSGSFVITALKLIKESGEFQGKQFKESRHYATLVVRLP